MKIRDRIREMRRVPASSLVPNPKNWRTHPPEQRDAIQGLFAEIGIAGATIVRELPDGSLQILDGHLRAEVLGDELVPVLVLDVTEDEADRVLATFDPIGAAAGVDAGKLSSLLSEIDFQSDAVQSLIARLAEQAGLGETPGPGDGGDEFDATPQEEGQTRSQVGDVWMLGRRHRLLVGDCTNASAIERLYAGRTPSIMVTDPPYGVNYDPTWRHKAGINKSTRTGAVANDDKADWTQAWLLFPGNVAYVWHGALHGSVVYDSLVRASFMVRAQIVWVKPRLVLSRGHYHWKHEPALVALRGEQDLDCELSYYAVRKGGSAEWGGGRKQTTAWEIGFSGEEKTHHGTQKPVECMARPIRNHGDVGDIVYDPFLGSGTTLIAAHRTGRICYGCELDPRYADVILRRAEAEGLCCIRES